MRSFLIHDDGTPEPASETAMNDENVIGVSMSEKQWCEKHWLMVRAGMQAGTHSGILATIALARAFIDELERMETANLLPQNIIKALHCCQQHQKVACDFMLMALSPLCCHFGDARMAQLVERSQWSHTKHGPPTEAMPEIDPALMAMGQPFPGGPLDGPFLGREQRWLDRTMALDVLESAAQEQTPGQDTQGLCS